MPSVPKKRDALRLILESLTPSEDDPHKEVSGVLLSDEITYYAKNHRLITPFEPVNLKPAGYELTIGDEYFLSGEFLTLDPKSNDKNKITIPPFEVAVLKTSQILCLPRYLIARWNIRVKHAYSGLLWVGGPQVDPGYVGHLFCPIYNLSDKPVTLHVGEPIALMDFVKTTPFDKSKLKEDLERYPFPPKRWILEDYDIKELRSALFTKAGAKLEEVSETIRNLEIRFITFTQISFAIFALMIALVAIISRIGVEEVSLGAAFWGAATIAASGAAVLMALFSYVNGRISRLAHERYAKLVGHGAKYGVQFLKRAWWLGMATCVVLALGGGWGLYELVQPYFQDLRQHRVLTKSDLDVLRASVSADIDTLSRRLKQVENSESVTPADLQKIKAELEQAIEAARPTAK